MTFLFSDAKVALPTWGSRCTENRATGNQAFVLLAAWLVNVNLYKAHIAMGQEITIES
jgi:hypothetical protein